MVGVEAVKENTKPGEKFLKKKEREACWKARDEFWKCFKENDENMDKCKTSRKTFMDLCPSTWVTHFDRKFQYEKFKEKVAKEGYQKMDENYTKKS